MDEVVDAYRQTVYLLCRVIQDIRSSDPHIAATVDTVLDRHEIEIVFDVRPATGAAHVLRKH